MMTMISETNCESPGRPSTASPETRKTPASTGAVFSTPVIAEIEAVPLRLDQVAGRQEQRGGRDAVVDHVEDRAGRALAGEHEDAQHDEAEVAQRGQTDQAQDVVLADGDQRAVHDRDQRQRDHDRRRPLRGVGEQPEAVAQHRVGADLVEDADQQHARAGGGLLGRVGQPGVHREQRRLDREGEEEAREQPLLGVGVDVDLRELAQQVRRVAGVGGDGVEADDRGEHDQAAGELEDQELDRGLLAALAAEVADEEVAGDQRGLEQDVEEEDVGRGEDTERQRTPARGPRRRTPWCCPGRRRTRRRR